MDNIKLGDFLSATVLKRLPNNHYSICINNKHVLSAYYFGELVLGNRYIFKLKDKRMKGRITLELLSSSCKEESIRSFATKFTKLSLLDDKAIVYSILALYLRDNLLVDESEVLDFYTLILDCERAYGKSVPIRDLISLKRQGIKSRELLSYIKDILFIENLSNSIFSKSYSSNLSLSVDRGYNLISVISSFLAMLEKTTKTEYEKINTRLDRIHKIEGKSFSTLAELGHFCFFTIPIMLYGRINFIKLGYMTRKSKEQSIHFSLNVLSNVSNIDVIKGVCFSKKGILRLKIISKIKKSSQPLSSLSFFNSKKMEKSYSYLRTINASNQIAETMSNISYGIFPYFSDSAKPFCDRHLIYFSLEKLLPQIGMLLDES